MKNDEMVYDIFKEIFNISVGKAADMLSQMLQKKILLDVASLKIVKLDNSNLDLHKFFHNFQKSTLMVSSISFMNGLMGDANLIFPADKMRVIINLCLGKDLEADNDLEFSDLDYDVTKEIGNVILNSIMGEIGNTMHKRLNYSLPMVKVFGIDDLEKRIKEMKYVYSLILCISFVIDEVEISGAIIINFTIDSLDAIMAMVKQMEEDLYE